MRPNDKKDRHMLTVTSDEMDKVYAKTSYVGSCKLFPTTHPSGYGYVQIRNITMSAHRLALVFRTRVVPKDAVTRHKCRNRNCIAVEHLEWGTVKQNAEDRWRDGTMKQSQVGLNHLPTFSRGQIRAAYLAYLKGDTRLCDVAAQFGMNKAFLKQVVKKRYRRKDVADLPDIAFDTYKLNSAKGTGHHNAKLNAEQVMAIRQACAQNDCVAEWRRLAALYNIGWQAVYKIKRRESWAHVP